MSDKRTTYTEIHDQALRELTSERCKTGLEKRRKMTKRLVAALKAWETARRAGAERRMLTRGAVLTINETNVRAGTKVLKLNVEVLGTNIGGVEFPPNAPAVFRPKAWLVEQVRPPVKMENGTLVWSKHDDHGSAIKKLIAGAEDAFKALKKRSQPERPIQAKLAEALSGGKLEYTELKNMTAVLIAGFPMEIATVLTAKGVAGTGQADIVARTKNGEFLVFEVKAPDGEPPRKALEQMIRYATALEREANLNAEVQTTYRAFLSPNGRSSGPLRFGAVAVVAVSREAEAVAALAALKLTGKETIRIGVLLYQPPEKMGDRLAPGGLRWLRKP